MNTGKKILIVFGTRPEAIKMAPVVKELLGSEKLKVKVCVTAQHREMLDQVLALFKIIPDYDLDIMKKGQDLFDVTTRILENIKEVISDYKPDLIMVHGDTTTSFIAALAGFYSSVAIAHVEAGLRTFNLQAPWPEEANRQLTGRLTSYHFAPTNEARQNLIKENVESESILVTGNTVIDALITISDKLHTPERYRHWNNYYQKLCGLRFPPLPAAYSKRLDMSTLFRFGCLYIPVCGAKTPVKPCTTSIRN